MLEREGDLLPDDPETLARRREASREASEGDERARARASAQMTDAGADARARAGRWREEKPITLHTISPEEALKYVSRVHHKEEVEAAEAAAELARQEAEQKSLREDEKARVDDSYLAAVEDAYDDITGDRDAPAQLERRRLARGVSIGAVRLRARRRRRRGLRDDRFRDYEALASDYDGHVSAGVSNPEDYDEDERLASALAELTGARPSSKSKTKTKKLSSRPPTLKKSPHSVDVHAKHARHAKHAARAAASSKQRARPRGVANRRSAPRWAAATLNPPRTRRRRPSATAARRRARRRRRRRRRSRRRRRRRRSASRAARGARRSRRRRTRCRTRPGRGRCSTDPRFSMYRTSGPGAASLGAARRVGAMGEAELAALVEAADGALDDFGPRA